MPEEQLKAFIEFVKRNTSLHEKLAAATTFEATVAIAKESGFAITAEDIQPVQSTTEPEVPDKELDGATGGAGAWRNNGTRDGVKGRTPGRHWVRNTLQFTQSGRRAMIC
nr:Nif11-like leader peptide family natural product precursor [Synechococcus sp. A18-25c]